MKFDAQIEENCRRAIHYLQGYSKPKLYCKKLSNQKPTANTVRNARRTTLCWMQGKIKAHDVIYQTWDAVFHHQMKHREESWKYVAEYFWRTSRCFIWWWNTVSNVWYFFSNKIIFEGEIKDANTEQFFIRFPNTH